jgi:hypothetical protein
MLGGLRRILNLRVIGLIKYRLTHPTMGFMLIATNDKWFMRKILQNFKTIFRVTCQVLNSMIKWKDGLWFHHPFTLMWHKNRHSIPDNSPEVNPPAMSNSNSHSQPVTDESTFSDRTTMTNQANSGNHDWLARFQHHSKLLMAWVEPGNFALYYANNAFCRLTGINAPTGNLQNQGIYLFDLFINVDAKTLEQLYRRHLLALILRDVYKINHINWRFLDEPVIATLDSPYGCEPHCVQFWLRSEHLNVERINPEINEFSDIDLSQQSIQQIIFNPIWEQRLNLENYRVRGQLLWEGLDVTHQEKIRQLISLLIERDSLLRSEKFRLFEQKMRSLFRADQILLLRVKRQEVKLFTSENDQLIQTQVYTWDSLQGSHFQEAAQANQVWIVANLESHCQTEFEQALFNQGTSSLLLIPLTVTAAEAETPSQNLMGMIGLTSDQADHFDSLDINHACALIPALTAALRQAAQSQFNHIHPAVEWRFQEEAERRSWGLSPEPIVFTDVHPMYGISDIRGSSSERNRSIQADLLSQFNLAMAVVDAANQYQHLPLLQQLRLDLSAYIKQLEKGVMAEAEVTAIQYLRDHLEIYFDYCQDCGDAAVQAVRAYKQACANPHGCVYTARDRYDRMIYEINEQLRQTWERWQIRMQQIIPHYCDHELTDGIDHMIYAGASINSQFTVFHLHCLRYEQLRAICDCARTCFQMRDRFDNPLQVTHLVLVQETTVDIFHDEQTEKIFDLRSSTRDTRYEIVKKRIDKALDATTQTRITQPGMLTIVYSTQAEWTEYQQYLRYLAREGWVDTHIESSAVERLQGITGLKFARVCILPEFEPAQV